MPVVHTLNKASLDHTASKDCFRALEKGDALVLIEDGVYLTQRGKIAKKSVTIFALQHDLHLRGLSPMQNRIHIIDDAEFVELCTRYDKIISWF
jgi:tRNA 2-thiouridine synthesizing protein B